MVKELPDKKIGVIAVAMGGSPIEMFDKDLYEQKYKDNYNEWWAQIARNYYGANPYGRIIEMAKKANRWVSSRVSCYIRESRTTATRSGPAW